MGATCRPPISPHVYHRKARPGGDRAEQLRSAYESHFRCTICPSFQLTARLRALNYIAQDVFECLKDIYRERTSRPGRARLEEEWREWLFLESLRRLFPCIFLIHQWPDVQILTGHQGVRGISNPKPADILRLIVNLPSPARCRRRPFANGEASVGGTRRDCLANGE